MGPAHLLLAALALAAGEPGNDPGPDHIAALIRQLGDDDYRNREAAGKELAAVGERAWYPLVKAAAGHPDAEVRARAERVAAAIARKSFGEVRRLGGAPGYWVNRVAFTPDGRRAVATGGGVIVYDLDTGRELRRSMELQFARPGLALSRDGKHFLTGHQHDPVVRLGDVETGKEVRQFRGHEVGVSGVALSADGHRAASAGFDGTVRVWDVASGKELRLFPKVPGTPRCVAISPDGKRVLSGPGGPGGGNLVRLWDVESGRELARFEGHTDGPTAVAFLPDGRSVVSGGADGTLRVWDAATGKELRRMRHPDAVWDVAVSPDGKRALAAGFRDRTARLWDLTDGTELYVLKGHVGAVLGVAFSADGRRALTSDSQGRVYLWRLPPAE